MESFYPEVTYPNTINDQLSQLFNSMDVNSYILITFFAIVSSVYYYYNTHLIQQNEMSFSVMRDILLESHKDMRVLRSEIAKIRRTLPAPVQDTNP